MFDATRKKRNTRQRVAILGRKDFLHRGIRLSGSAMHDDGGVPDCANQAARAVASVHHDNGGDRL